MLDVEPTRIPNLIMAYMARGLSADEIADVLGIPVRSVLRVIWASGDDRIESNPMQGEDPTPEVIRLRCLAIQEEWTDEDRLKRQVAKPVPMTVPECSLLCAERDPFTPR